jgi:hypothetical protein
VKCTFDSSASVNMMMTMNACIRIATVMTTKFICRSHNSSLDLNDNNIHNVRNVFVPFDADDVVVIFEFCRSEFLI